ncbi:MAG: hypothetical protein KatS3mg062_0687 [Tepidiforma sp.]|nr:MAG: hypothetical protein KatS3mg062_0687 [Tepidiforma sp.]
MSRAAQAAAGGMAAWCAAELVLRAATGTLAGWWSAAWAGAAALAVLALARRG